MLRYVPLIGWLGMAFGLMTALFSWPYWPYLHFAMLTMIPGFLLSSLYIMTTTKHEMKTPRINPGYIGIILSSAPLIMFILFALSN